MPEYIVIIICLYILAAVGMLKGPCEAAGMSLFKGCYALLAAAALSIFQLHIGVEISINLGAAILMVLPAALMAKEGSSSAGAGAVVLISLIAALLKRSGALYGADNGLLLGLMAGMSAMLLWNAPACAACAAGGIPVLAAVADSFISLIFTGYATIEIGHDTIAAQLVALSISVGIIWIHDLAGNRVPTE